MGKPSRDKGARTERNVVRAFQEAGIAGERVPLSGAAGGRWKGDIEAPVLGVDRRFEVKCRAKGFAFQYDKLADNYGLVMKADNRPFLITIRLDDFLKLCLMADQWRLHESVLSAPFLMPKEG